MRRHRLQRNYLQEGLCHDTCTVPYLSELEQGKVQTVDEIYQALPHRLGIMFQENKKWLAVWKGKPQELVSAWFYGEQREAYELEKQMESLLNFSPCVDVLLVKVLYTKEYVDKPLAFASVFFPYIQDAQRSLYHFLCAGQALQSREE